MIEDSIVKNLIFVFLLTFVTSVNAIEMSYTYSDVQNLKVSKPDIANAYLKGIAETAFIMHSSGGSNNVFCPPRGTAIDIELIDLVAHNEVKIHQASSSEYFNKLVKTGLLRSFPCKK